MKNAIFLSASVPDPKRDSKYYETADVTGIREAVIALANYVLPKTTLIWGGHPAITPMIRVVADKIGISVQERVVMYQSLFYEGSFPKDNQFFAHIIQTPRYETKDKSLAVMRQRMLRENKFKAGIFIGGMEGVEEEFKLFKEFHPSVPVYPLFSTGGAAQIIFGRYNENFPQALKDDYAYYSLFRKLLRLDAL